MDLIRTGLLTAVATAIRLLASFATNKVVAVVAGPGGMALLGQVHNCMGILQGLSGGLFGTAAVKYTAEWKDEPDRLNPFLGLTFTLCLWLSIAIGMAISLGCAWLSRLLLNDVGYWWVFVCVGLSAPLLSANHLMLSVLNGLGEIRRLTAVNIAQSVLGLGVSVGLPLLFGVNGAMAAVALSSAVAFGILAPRIRQSVWSRVQVIRFAEQRENLARLGRFALMAGVSGVCAPLAQVLVRECLIDRCSVTQAGYWQALMRLSGAYLAFFTSTLSVYFLPRFSALGSDRIMVELRRGYAVLLPLLLLLFAGIWGLRGKLVPLLFTSEFGPIRDLLAYQLVGDFLKISSWIIAYLMLAKARVWLYIGSELFFSSLYVGLALLLVGSDGSGGTRGALFAWIAVYAVYWVFLLVLLPRLTPKVPVAPA